MINWLIRTARRIYVWGLVRETGHRKELIEQQLSSIAKTLIYLEAEGAVIEASLMRQFDPAPIWNAAINRAIERKKAAREAYHMPHSAAFSVQQETTRKALRNA